MIQFVTLGILYYNTTNLTDWQFLYIDMLIIDSIALTMSYNDAADTISEKKPPFSLMSAAILTSLFVQIGIQTAFQVAFYLFTVDPSLSYATTVFPCYREGYISRGTEKCACTYIQDPDSPALERIPKILIKFLILRTTG